MFNCITIGYDCSPAAALRGVNLRNFALPFDWVVSNISSLDVCFRDNFRKYHRELYYSNNKTRLIDAYGFQFPHDYPTEIDNLPQDYSKNFENMKDEDVTIKNNEVVITENTIVKNWADHHETVLSKYDRRIKRFLEIMNDPKPIIVLCRYSTYEVLELQKLFLKYYHKENLYFINSTQEVFENDKIVNIYTEKNGEWNELIIWKSCLDAVILKHNLQN
jgi:hypothetical protein